jgi:hypothetical protein
MRLGRIMRHRATAVNAMRVGRIMRHRGFRLDARQVDHAAERSLDRGHPDRLA